MKVTASVIDQTIFLCAERGGDILCLEVTIIKTIRFTKRDIEYRNETNALNCSQSWTLV